MTLAASPTLATFDLRPKWLRPAALGTAAAAHLALFAAFLLHDEPPTSPFDSYDVALVQEGEAAPQAASEATPDEQMPDANSTITQAAAEAQMEEAPKVKQQVAETPLAVEKAQTVAPDAVTVAQIDKRQDDPDKPTLKDKVEAKDKQDPTLEQTPTDATGQVRRTASAAADALAAAAAVERAGVDEGKSSRSAASVARYGAKVLAALHKRMFYPRDARAAHVTGHAVVVFTVGAEGRVIDRRIERSAGSDALDKAALAMLDALAAPPPPLGRFLGRTTIRFDIRQ
jgi:protein TonB